MPGINQLKKFINNMTSIGNEPNVRSQRGEYYEPLSLPTNIKDVDDADDFLYGIVDGNSNGQSDSFGDITPESMNPDDFNLDYLISGQNNASSSDVESSLDEQQESQLSSEPSFSLPEEEINLDALSDFMDESENEVYTENFSSNDEDSRALSFSISIASRTNVSRFFA